MFGSQVLDVVVGLVFVYLLLSIICTAANEMVASLFALRARNLARGIANLLADRRIKGLDELFYDHPLIKSLYQGTRKPSYVPSRTFALAFLDGITPFKADGTELMPEIRAAVNALPGDSELKRQLLIMLQQAGDDFPKLLAGIETWFDDSMTRVSGWYKRRSQVITVIVALLLTGITNADTFQIVKVLSVDTALRASVVAQAQEFARQQPVLRGPQPGKELKAATPSSTAEKAGLEQEQPPPSGPRETMTQTFGSLQHLGIPLGWQAVPKQEDWINKIIGLLLTTFAITLGAPFWFDLLNRVSKVRSTGAAPAEPTKETKKEKPA
jgi:hypothetical protein